MPLSLISPVLASVGGLEVPMPRMSSQTYGMKPQSSRMSGVPQIVSSALNIAAFGDEVELLKTRTRPKKMRLLASDGRSCTFLLKVRFGLINIELICCWLFVS